MIHVKPLGRFEDGGTLELDSERPPYHVVVTPVVLDPLNAQRCTRDRFNRVLWVELLPNLESKNVHINPSYEIISVETIGF